MFTLLEKLVSLLLGATKALQEQKDRKLKRDFGKALITFYIRLLEVTHAGEEILSILEHGNYHLLNRGRRVAYSYHNILTEQSLNVERLTSAFVAVQRELQVMAPDVAERMSLRMEQKSNVLGLLVANLRQGILPTRILLVGPDGDDRSWFDEGQIEIFCIDFRREPESGAEGKTHEEVHTYLTTSDPREQLRTMVQCAEEIRVVLIQHFKLEEILWGTEQLRHEGHINGIRF